MPKYEVRLESQTDSQARIMSLDAESPDVARKVAEQSELDVVNFTLLPPGRDVWESPPGGPDSPDGLVDLSRWDAYDPEWARHAATLPYDEAARAAKARLDDFNGRIEIDAKGKVHGRQLGKHTTARLLAHRQTEPYAIADVREVDQAEIDRLQLVRMAQRLVSNPLDWQRTLDALRDAGIPMAVVTAFLNGVPWQKQIDGSSVTVFSSAAIKMSLHTALTGAQDTDDFFNDISASEIAGSGGYTTGGYTFAAKTTAYDTASDQVRLDNTTDPSWTTSTLSATDAAITNTTPGTAATNPVYAEIDFGATVTTTAGTFSIVVDATGWCVVDLT